MTAIRSRSLDSDLDLENLALFIYNKTCVVLSLSTLDFLLFGLLNGRLISLLRTG